MTRLLGTPEIQTLIARIGETRQTGRPGYPMRTMVGLALVKALHALPTWTRVVRLVGDHAAVRVALGIGSDDMPSHWACYRFATKLRDCGDALDECIASVLSALHAEHPDMGEKVAIEGSDLPAYANGQRYLYNRGPERGTSKWRCPTGECTPASVWVKADRLHTLVPRSTKRWKDTYRQRGCVERGFGWLKNEWGCSRCGFAGSSECACTLTSRSSPSWSRRLTSCVRLMAHPQGLRRRLTAHGTPRSGPQGC